MTVGILKKMEEKKKEDMKDVFISFLDDDGITKGVWCDLIEETIQYVKFKIRNEILTIPYHRILKIKKKEKEERRKNGFKMET